MRFCGGQEVARESEACGDNDSDCPSTGLASVGPAFADARPALASRGT